MVKLKEEYKINRFIQKSKEVHGDRFDYSKVIYINPYTNVILTCKKHNLDFEILPAHHFRSNISCDECRKTKNNDLFIKRIKLKYGDRYDYSKVIYTSAHDKIILICNKHNKEFEVYASHILNKERGCPLCHKKGYVYAPYEKVKPFNIKSMKDYFVWYENNLQFCETHRIPKHPHNYYSKKVG